MAPNLNFRFFEFFPAKFEFPPTSAIFSHHPIPDELTKMALSLADLPLGIRALLVHILYSDLGPSTVETGFEFALLTTCRDFYYPLRSILGRMQFYRAVGGMCNYVRIYEGSLYGIDISLMSSKSCRWIESRSEMLQQEYGLTDCETEHLEEMFNKDPSYAARVERIEDFCMALESNPYFEIDSLICRETF